MAWARCMGGQTGGRTQILSQDDMSKVGAVTLNSNPVKWKIPIYGMSSGDNYYIRNADNEYYWECGYSNNKSFRACAKIPASAKTLYVDASCGSSVADYPNFFVAVTENAGITSEIIGYSPAVKAWRITQRDSSWETLREQDGGNVIYTSNYVAPRQVMTFDLTPYNQELYFGFYCCNTVVQIWNIWAE